MALTPDQIASIRMYLGDSEPPDDDELFQIFTRHEESLTATAIEVTQKRIATLAAGGALDFSVPGEYSENRSANLKALQDILKNLATFGIEGDEVFVGAGEVTIGNVGRTFPR